MRPAQNAMMAPSYPPTPHGHPSAPVMTLTRSGGGEYINNTAYPSLVDFMGLELSEEMIRLNMPEYLAVSVPQQNSSNDLSIFF